MKLPLGTNDFLDIEGDKTLTYNEGLMIGWLVGDGWISSRNNDTRREYGFIFNNNEEEISKKILNIVNSLKDSESSLNEMGKSNIGFQISNRKFDILVRKKYKPFLNKNDGIPKSVWKSNDKYIKGFISGLFTSDGNITKKEVCLTTSRKKIALDLTKLLSFYGIKSNVTHRKRKPSFPNGKDYNKIYDSYRVRISGRYVLRFKKLFNLYGEKKDKLEKIKDVNLKYKDSRDYEIIKSIELTKIKEDVWDLTVYDDTHCFQCDYVITGNCLEQTLEPYELCCVTGDTRIQTKGGTPKIKDVVGKEVEVWNGKQWSKVTPFKASNSKNIFRVILSDGSYLDVTDNHEW
jgi:hypothetical protein